MERAIRVIGWAGVIVGLSGVLPGIFLLRGGMIELGMLVLLLSALVLLGLGALEELRHIRRGIARLAVRSEADPLRDATGGGRPVHQGQPDQLTGADRGG